jgi:hypothetical protein
MAVFDGSIKTARRVKDPVTDKRVVTVASISLATINSSAALLYPGTDVSVVHGDQQLHVDQNRIMKIGMNQDVTIGMNEIYLVDMNQNITVMQNYTRDVMMNSLINTTGNYTKNVLSNYVKNVTGSSSNAIFGFYSKNVALDYTKTITGTSTNMITGIYSKTVQSNYLKHVQGSSTATIIGDYNKSVISNYVKVVTGNSNVRVTSQSIVSYVGDHSRTFGNDHKMYISGTNTQTTIGPTIRTEIDVTVSQQVDNHVDAHPSNLNEDKNHWFTAADKKGTWQRYLKMDYTSGFYSSGSIFKLDVNGANYGVNGTTNAVFVEKMDCGFNKNEIGCAKNKWNGVSIVGAGVIAKVAVNTSKAVVATAHAGGASVKFLGGILQAVPAKIQAGVTWAINQFM